MYSGKFVKAKIESYNRKINTNFCNNQTPKEGPQYICLSVILLCYIFRTGKNYYPQVVLKEFKHFIKEKRFISILLTM